MKNSKKLTTAWYVEMKNRKIALAREEREAIERGDVDQAAEYRRQIDLLDPPEATARRRERSAAETEKRKEKRQAGGLAGAILRLVQGMDTHFSDRRKTLSVGRCSARSSSRRSSRVASDRGTTGRAGESKAVRVRSSAPRRSPGSS